MCEELFDRNCDMENHIRNIHESFETYDCDKCEKTFVLEWRLKKHREGHDRILKKCHYFNNQKSCPYENVGCMFDHAFSGSCRYGKKCTNKMCPFQHDHGTTENNADGDEELKEAFEKFDGMEKFEANKVICNFFCNDDLGYHKCNEEDFQTFIGLDAPNVHTEVDSENKSKQYLPCEKCYEEFEEYAHLKKHFLTKHTKDRFLECIVEDCKFEAKSITQLTMHICVNHYELVREKLFN